MTIAKLTTILVLIVVSSVVYARVPEGRIYVLHSQAAGACPPLDWHILVETNGVLAGMISWNGMKTMARATGAVNRQAHTFAMAAKELGGQARIIKVAGQIQDNGTIIAKIQGVNVSCDAVVVPIYADRPAAN
jgi:hypothetical protein